MTALATIPKTSPARPMSQCVLTIKLSGRPQPPCRGQTRPTMLHGPLERVVSLHCCLQAPHSRSHRDACPDHPQTATPTPPTSLELRRVRQPQPHPPPANAAPPP